MTRPLIRTFMPQINQHLLNTRQKFEYRLFPYRNKLYSNSFFPAFTKKWIATTLDLRQESDINEYKMKLKNKFKPTKFRFFSRSGSKRGAALMTQLRVGRSYLNDHSFAIGLSESAACSCASAPRESTRPSCQNRLHVPVPRHPGNPPATYYCSVAITLCSARPSWVRWKLYSQSLILFQNLKNLKSCFLESFQKIGTTIL